MPDRSGTGKTAFLAALPGSQDVLTTSRRERFPRKVNPPPLPCLGSAPRHRAGTGKIASSRHRRRDGRAPGPHVKGTSAVAKDRLCAAVAALDAAPRSRLVGCRAREQTPAARLSFDGARQLADSTARPRGYVRSGSASRRMVSTGAVDPSSFAPSSASTRRTSPSRKPRFFRSRAARGGFRRSASRPARMG